MIKNSIFIFLLSIAFSSVKASKNNESELDHYKKSMMKLEEKDLKKESQLTPYRGNQFLNSSSVSPYNTYNFNKVSIDPNLLKEFTKYPMSLTHNNKMLLSVNNQKYTSEIDLLLNKLTPLQYLDISYKDLTVSEYTKIKTEPTPYTCGMSYSTKTVITIPLRDAVELCEKWHCLSIYNPDIQKDKSTIYYTLKKGMQEDPLQNLRISLSGDQRGVFDEITWKIWDVHNKQRDPNERIKKDIREAFEIQTIEKDSLQETIKILGKSEQSLKNEVESFKRAIEVKDNLLKERDDEQKQFAKNLKSMEEKEGELKAQLEQSIFRNQCLDNELKKYQNFLEEGQHNLNEHLKAERKERKKEISNVLNEMKGSVDTLREENTYLKQKAEKLEEENKLLRNTAPKIIDEKNQEILELKKQLLNQSSTNALANISEDQMLEYNSALKRVIGKLGIKNKKPNDFIEALNIIQQYFEDQD